jgi:hypothetical protein
MKAKIDKQNRDSKVRGLRIVAPGTHIETADRVQWLFGGGLSASHEAVVAGPTRNWCRSPSF